MCIMKKETLSFKLGRRKTRAIELFTSDTPFKPKRVESKLHYKRKAKHPKQMVNFD